MTDRGRAFLRHVAGFAVAPAIAPLAIAAIELARSGIGALARDDAMTYAAVRSIVSSVRFLVPPGYAVALVLGVPIVLALRAAGRLTVPWLVGVSAGVAGTLAAAAIAVGTWIEEVPLEDLPLALLLAAIAAALAAAVSGAHGLVAGVPLREDPRDGPRSAG
ncbi:MAG TPA: hypothetical protein VFL83_02970 [Anaeromyxobacter sp.]|nr:hypothetical protein [Anaeromyxobacter sp.]